MMQAQRLLPWAGTTTTLFQSIKSMRIRKRQVKPMMLRSEQLDRFGDTIPNKLRIFFLHAWGACEDANANAGCSSLLSHNYASVDPEYWLEDQLRATTSRIQESCIQYGQIVLAKQTLRFKRFPFFIPEIDQRGFRKSNLNIFRSRLQNSKKQSRNIRFKHFLTLAPEVDKMDFRRSDLNIFWPWLQKSPNGSQNSRFKHFLTLAPEVDKMDARMSDLSILWRWLQKSTKWFPGNPI